MIYSLFFWQVDCIKYVAESKPALMTIGAKF